MQDAIHDSGRGVGADTAEKPRLLTFASGGWVLVLTAVLSVVIAGSVLVPAMRRHAQRPPGNLNDRNAYGFELSPSLVSMETLVPAQAHRDLLQALVDPAVMRGTDVEAHNREMRGKYIVPNDLVIGVQIGNEARAYPLNVMNLHEIANDRVGGVPIAVTYNPLCDSVVVFERTVDGETLEFGVSGLVSNSNLLMYDRRANTANTANTANDAGGSAESLWSQLRGAAVTGPAANAGRTLRRIPAVVTHWQYWLADHPETTILDPDPQMRTRYKETNYVGYFRSPELIFPVDHQISTSALPLKAACVAVYAGGERRVYPFSLVADRADENDQWTDTVGGTPFTFTYRRDPIAVEVNRPDGAPADAVTGLWFAWYAMDPDIDVAQ